ncbi:predicted protein [Phaeodactylum tricornutum CCAP 1055/1]|uniref:Uncharacterized protein n=1 Tax=Phaeodactylum tricornutum (strain CCAP 1055/1) TaxID=556484 RepID=B7GBX4_PHATC|nr:predicted protein [Phaeodactylum tricornutum CCAP 1055/1]EEC43924.1 predicted protein [Phaeodactylum tricornutum CCAP 1055/1]|eukprot:XP_002184525.1 predicted protein [Phaeodactylum tricornutum CCAP 1055/1]
MASHLAETSSGELHLSDGKKGGLPELLKALESINVRSIHLDGSSLADWEKAQVEELLKKIGNLSSMRSLHLFGGSFTALSLAELLRTASKLQFSEIGRTLVEGDEDAISDFNGALYGHKSLEEFIAMDFDFCLDKTKLETSIDDLIKSLSTIPTLRVVKIEASSEHKMYCSKFCLAPLMRAKSLTTLLLARLPLEPMHFNILAFSIARSSLIYLALPYTNMDDEAAANLSAACVASDAVEEIDFSSNEIGDIGCIAIASNLTETKTVRVVRLEGNKAIGSKGYGALAEMLTANYSVEILEIGHGGDAACRVVIDEQLSKNRAVRRDMSAHAA